MHVLCLLSIASVVLVLGSPASASPAGAAAPADGTAAASADLRADAAAPPRDAIHPRPPGPAALPVDGVTPLSWGAHRVPAPGPVLPPGGVAPLRVHIPARPPPPATGWMPIYVAPLNRGPAATVDPLSAGPRAPAGSPQIAAPFGSGPPAAPPDRPDPRALRVIRLELLVGPVWRIRPAETMVLAGLEAGRLHGFSGTFHVGMVIAPERVVAVTDFPIGGGFVYRWRLGERPLYASVGLSAGLLVHRAATDIGVVHRVDPDLQLPLRFAWTAGRVGLSVALLQGFSFRTRTYERRGVEVWRRIPYRIGFAVGLHFDIGVGRAKPRRAAR